MDISVDLPAPFSPTMPWIVPRCTVMEMSLLACTGPNALEIPRNSIAGGTGAAESCRADWSVIVLMPVAQNAGQVLSAR